MRDVQVLQATKTAPNSRGRNNNYAVQIDRIRVAAYCRVSTDGDEQLGSFESQKLYYEEKIRKNKEWAMAGIFADEAITGTKIDKREGFQEMIRKCLNGEIDMILTKSISRFSRNTLMASAVINADIEPAPRTGRYAMTSTATPTHTQITIATRTASHAGIPWEIISGIV